MKRIRYFCTSLESHESAPLFTHQIQVQVAICYRKGCDFVVFINDGNSTNRFLRNILDPYDF